MNVTGYTTPDPTGEPLCTLTLQAYDAIGACALASSGAEGSPWLAGAALLACAVGWLMARKGWVKP